METCAGIITSLHAFKRMLERSISDTDVESVIMQGEIIQQYPNDKPYPSKLIFKMVNDIPVACGNGKKRIGRMCDSYGLRT